MLIWTAKFSKKRAVAAVLFLGFVMAALILLMGRAPEDPAPPPPPRLTTNALRVDYLRSLGWDVEEEPIETLQFLMPETLEEPYLSYNDLQTSQGFDLASCCGKQLTRYTYAVRNHPARADGVQANLYICEDLPVAGDLFCPGSDGFQDPLVPPAE